MGVRGRLPWQVSATDELFDDFMIRPLGLEAGQVIEYLPLPEEYLSKQLAGKSVLLVGENDTTVEMARAASSAGALVQVVGSTAEISTIKLILESLATLDMLFISAGPTSVVGTLETDAAAWERLFDAHCKGPYYFVAHALPLLRQSQRPRIVMVAPAPLCDPEGLSSPAVPAALIAQIRGLYVVGMAEELKSDEQADFSVGSIWDRLGLDPPATDCLALLSGLESTGRFAGANWQAPCPTSAPPTYTCTYSPSQTQKSLQ